MDLGNFAKWFACQVEIDSADRTAERAMDAACAAIATSGNFHGQGGHLIDVATREGYRAEFYEAIQKGFENKDTN